MDPEFRAVLSYRLMFWTGICDVSQLIMFLLAGIMAMLQSAFFHHYINKVIYIVALIIFVVSWAVKLTPYTGYLFKPSTLNWGYDENGIQILSRISYYFSNYTTLFYVGCCITVYSIIAARIVVVRREPLKWTEVVLTLQQFLVASVFFLAFLYWYYVDTGLEPTILTNFIGDLIWITTVGLNPLIYLFVNKRLRKSLRRITRPKQTTTAVGGLNTLNTAG
ncbi:unnamed protein product [Cylicocyclus nassatus]|uniref:Uncharacterized protein n=1 Tax=Cylicocyclus nassatus TaxID=53992 RepID=A0AA36DMW0_CYLNA|nr:unnamed protein product [Cylicocyclus nassatus]